MYNVRRHPIHARTHTHDPMTDDRVIYTYDNVTPRCTRPPNACCSHKPKKISTYLQNRMCAPTRAHLQTIDAANTQACSHYMGLLSSNTYPTRWRGGADPQRSKRDSKPCGKRLAQIHKTVTSSNAWRHTQLHDATPLQHAAQPLHFTAACPHNATPRRAWSELADGLAGMKGEVEKRHMVKKD